MDSRDRSPTLFRPGRPVRPRRLYLLLSALTGLFNSITFTLYGVYVVTGAGFDPLQLVLAGTAVEFAVFVSEVPTGVVADAYSRRVSLIGGAIATGLAGRLSAVGEGVSTRPLVRTLTALTVVLTIASFAFALTGSIWVALVALWITAWVRVAIQPLTLIWLNRGLAPRSRATVISMLGQSDALGQVAGGPVLGLVGTLRTVRTALAGVGLILLPALGLYGRELVRGDEGVASDEGD